MKQTRLFRYTANAISFVRIAICAALVFTVSYTALFYVLYLLAGVSDLADGFVARITHTESAFGAVLDSIADIVFVSVCIFRIIPLPETWVLIWAGIIAAVKIPVAVYAVCFRKKPEMLHNAANRITGILFFVMPLTVPFADIGYSAAAVCVSATAAAVYELIALFGE